MIAYKPNDLNKRCQIGNLKTITTATGGSKQDLDNETAVTLWYGAKTRSLGLQFSLVGTEAEDAFEIVVRHNPSLEAYSAAKIDGILYKVINVSPDDSANLNPFDIITLKKITKGA